MVNKRSAFTTSQMRMVVEAGKRAEKLFRSHID
jgi:hypothetical protein